MSEQGLIELAGEYPTPEKRHKSMHYSLSHHGRTALRYELDRLEHAIKIARSAGLLDQPPPTEVELLLAGYQVASS